MYNFSEIRSSEHRSIFSGFKMKRKRDENIENRSFKMTTMQGLTVMNGIVSWEEETRLARIDTHGSLFDRFFSFDEITAGKTPLGLKLHANLSFKCIGAETFARLEVKVIEGAEKFENIAIELGYSYDDYGVTIR